MLAPSPKKLAHVVLKTYDVERLSKWYCAVLGAYPTFEQLPYTSFITYDDEHHRLGIALIPGDPKPRVFEGPGLVHIAFTFADIRGLLARYELLKAEGILPAMAINHGPTVSFYYSDPDGNAIELQIDRLSLQDGMAFMATRVFQANPTGVPIDADKLARRMREGAEDEELLFYDAQEAVDVPALNKRLMEITHMI